jgi:hypothetical protein
VQEPVELAAGLVSVMRTGRWERSGMALKRMEMSSSSSHLRASPGTLHEGRRLKRYLRLLHLRLPVQRLPPVAT